MNLVLITSIISPPNKPLSYTRTRSVFNTEERFNDTKKTIESIKAKIPNYYIAIVECSKLSIEQEKYFKSNSNYFVNFYNKKNIRDNVYSKYKAIGESTQTINIIKSILENVKDIDFKNFIKISGRYWLSNKFDFSIFDNDKIVVKQINKNKQNILTALYKIPFKYIIELKIFFINEQNVYKRGIGFEVSFSKFPTKYKDITIYLDKINLQGQVSIDGNMYDG